MPSVAVFSERWRVQEKFPAKYPGSQGDAAASYELVDAMLEDKKQRIPQACLDAI